MFALVNSLAAAGFAQNDVAKMLSELKKFGANGHLYIPGVGAISGITAGNYLDSVGTTNASVDGNVGLVLDGAGSVGAELNPNPEYGGAWVAAGTTPPTANANDTFQGSACRSVTFPAIASGGYSVSRAEGAAFNSVLSTTYRCEYEIATSRPLVSGESIIVVFTGSNAIGMVNLNPANTAAVAFSKYVVHPVASVGGFVSLRPYAGTLLSPVTLYIRKASAKAVAGINALQPTTGYQPTLRRGVVNLLTYSNDLSNAAWSKNAVSVAANKIVADTSTGYHSTSRGYVVPAGTNQTLAFLLSSAEYSKARLSDNSSGEWYCSVDLSTGVVSASGGARLVSADAVKLSDGNVLAAVVVTGNGVVKGYAVAGYPNSGATLGIYGAQYTGDGVSGIYLYSMGIIQGTLTAAQILAAGGIPVTATAPASSPAGAYKWELDGVDDSISLGVVPFQMSDDHCVIAMGNNLAGSGTRYIIDFGSTGSANPICGSVGFSNSAVVAQWRDDAGTANLLYGGNFPLGMQAVVTARKVGNSFSLRANGAQVLANLATLSTTTLTGGKLGVRVFGSNLYQGVISGAVVIKGTVTDAQALIFERGLNALSQYAAGIF